MKPDSVHSSSSSCTISTGACASPARRDPLRCQSNAIISTNLISDTMLNAANAANGNDSTSNIPVKQDSANANATEDKDETAIKMDETNTGENIDNETHPAEAGSCQQRVSNQHVKTESQIKQDGTNIEK
ncbi:unnamed protein product [Cylindrotheca closterium]|uniref:Uncharacterized protein n=1 Tax=Cylindrotheca closterium TaxID=2856 RepID=A0AAD2FCU6_9STRA|nr:unnamed protein product [Cylindrotheca closterium]